MNSANQIAPGARLNFSLIHVEDWIEIFHNRNNRDLTIEIENTSSVPNTVCKVVAILRRSQPNSAEMGCWINCGGPILNADNWHGSYYAVRGNSVTATGVDIIRFIQMLAGAFYVGPFRNAISEGSGNYLDIAIGTSFIAQWDEWKTGSSRRANENAQQVADDIAHIFDFARFEINATPDKKALQVIINGKPYKLRELGAGLAQFIIVFGNVAISRCLIPTLRCVVARFRSLWSFEDLTIWQVWRWCAGRFSSWSENATYNATHYVQCGRWSIL